MISPKSIEEVLNTVQIEQVLEDFIDLKRAGSNFKGLCPFHDEKTPSFMVSPAKGIYKCFGCGEGGDSVKFIREHEKLSYPEAIRWLANKYNIELEETATSPEYQQEKQKKDSLYIINEFAQSQFEYNLLETDEGKSIGVSYFSMRGYGEKTIKKWGLGYADSDKNSLFQALQKNQYNIELSQTIGLLKEDRDFFIARVTFPIRNLSGKIIGFGARTLSQNKKVPKYLNSPESEIYNKSNVLYGMYNAKSDIRKLDNCYMVEGYTDVIRLSDNGIPNVVASSGTSLTDGQIKLVKRFSQNITIIYDGDNAGIKAALRGLDKVLTQDMNVRLVLLPEGEDPDSYLQKVGADAFKKFLEENTQDFILFKINLLLNETKNDPIRKSEVIKDIISSVAHIHDPVKRNVYVKECSRLLDLEESVIQKEANKIIKRLLEKEQTRKYRDSFPSEKWEPKREEEPKPETATVIKTSSDHASQEKDLIRILFNFGGEYIDEASKTTVASYLYQNIAPIFDYFDNDIYVQILNEVPTLLSDEKNLSLKHWIQHQDEKIQQLAVDLSSDKYIYANWKSRGIELQTQASPEKNFIKDTISSVLRFKLKKLKRAIKEQEKMLTQVSDANDENLKYHIIAYNEAKEEIIQISKLLRTVVL